MVFGYLPADWKILSKTKLFCCKLPIREVQHFFNLVSFHLGLANGIILSLLKIGVGNPPNVIEIIISVDGLPAYQLQKAIEASFGLFWPEHVVKSGFVFVFGIYHEFIFLT